ncbi:hypothetical protein CDD82_260 [Ophiocordyceps australis]|uniref:C2H2-type domain-containing protein n=1 Tax=Ophiocordyceps australis TaxID=1399860 RepID=A0A2C5YM81_9HYPO|nr:hypothetical protein CDD82_260 [Ophiocordyceps australis]
MELADELYQGTEKCLSLFQAASDHQTIIDDDWFEDRAADFAWWAHGLKAQKRGRSSLDFRLRERPDIQKVVADLLESLAFALMECLPSYEDPNSTRPSQHGETLESDEGSTDSPWSEFSDEEKQQKRRDTSADTPNTAQSNAKFFIETNLKLLAKISIAIRKSGTKLRYLKADEYLEAHSNDEEYTKLRAHLSFLILFGSYEQQLFCNLLRQAINQEISKAVEIVIRSWILDPARLTSDQRRLIEANITRRNRIVYARRFLNKKSPPTDSKKEAPKAVLQSTKSGTVGVHADKPFEDPSQTLSKPEPANSLTENTLTATELGSHFVLPIIPSEPGKAALSITTKLTQTATNLDYPPCPAEKGSFSCPYCAQVLTEDYIESSRWRGHVAQDLNPYSCTYKDCKDSHNLYSFEEWIKHTKDQHNKERWVCDECTFISKQDDNFTFNSNQKDEYIFDNQQHWESHMRSCHKCPDNRLTLLASMNKRKLTEFTECPLCKWPRGRLSPDQGNHIAQHLHAWALRALPWKLNSDDRATCDSADVPEDQDDQVTQTEALEDDDASMQTTISDAVKREITRWECEDPIPPGKRSRRLDTLIIGLQDNAQRWTTRIRLDTHNETVLQHLLNINQTKAQFYLVLHPELEGNEFTPQQQHDIDINLCENIELCIGYMNKVFDEARQDALEHATDTGKIEALEGRPDINAI